MRVLEVVQDSKFLLNTYPVASWGLDEGKGRHIRKGETPDFSELTIYQKLSPEQHVTVRES